jgi:hypothetical protein
MAARRLILVMLVLLVLSSAVAALIPVERDRGDETSTTTTATTAAPPPTGTLVHRHVDADRARPGTIRIDRGDQLELTVTSAKPGQVEIIELGVLEDVDRFLPARLDLLPSDQGTYPVRLVPPAPAGSEGRIVARVVVDGRGSGQESPQRAPGASEERS